MKNALRVAACVAALAVAALVNAASLRVGSAAPKGDAVYRRYWTEQSGVRSGTHGEPLSYVVDGGVVDAGVPVSDGGGFEPAANAYLSVPDPLPTEDFCITVEGSDTETDGEGTAWQYTSGDDPIFWQLGEPGGANSAYFAPTADGVLYLETCDNSGDWKSWSTAADTLTQKDATVTACRQKNGDWKLYVNNVEQPTVTDGTGAGVQTVVGLDMVMGAGPGFGYRCTCGDGFVDCLEGCDDGDATGADGCSASCAVESNYICTGEPSNCTVICGDGNYDSPEECDDGNAVAADGCASCLVEAGFQCTGWPSTCVTTCGDGTKAGTEECDDGNVVDGDGCDANCTSEPTPIVDLALDGVSPWVNEGSLGGTYVSSGAIVADSSGHTGTAVSNDTSRSSIVSSSTVFPALSAITVSAWIFDTNASDSASYDKIIAKTNNASGLDPWTDIELAYAGTSNSWFFKVSTGGAGSGRGCAASTVLPVGRWVHVGATYDGRYTKLYQDGALVSSCDFSTTSAIHASDQPLFLFANTGYSYGEETFFGRIDDVKIYDQALSGAYFEQFAPVCGDGFSTGAEACDDGNLVDGDGCSADCTLEIVDQYYFSFNSDICDTDGVADYTSNGVDTGTYMFRATCLDSGLSGRSATTPGANWMAISLPAFKPQQFSVAYWMKLNEQPLLWNKMIAARAGNNSDNTKAFIAQFRMNEGTGVWDTSVYHGSGVYTGINSKDYAEVPELTVDGLWHHFGMTFDGSYLRLYFDGVLVKSQVANSSTVYYAEGSGQWEFSGNYNYNNESVPASWDNLHISGGVYSAAWFANAYNNHL